MTINEKPVLLRWDLIQGPASGIDLVFSRAAPALDFPVFADLRFRFAFAFDSRVFALPGQI